VTKAQHRREPQARRRGVGRTPARLGRGEQRDLGVGAGEYDDVAGVWARSTGADPSAMIPGSVAKRCMSRRPSAARIAARFDALAADHHEPACPAFVRQPGAVEMLLDALADCLDDLAAVASGHLEEALDP